MREMGLPNVNTKWQLPDGFKIMLEIVHYFFFSLILLLLPPPFFFFFSSLLQFYALQRDSEEVIHMIYLLCIYVQSSFWLK